MSDDDALPQHPHNAEIEQALIGSVILDPEAIDQLDILDNDLYIVRNRYIWQAVTALRRRKEPVDYLTLSRELEERGKLGEIGGKPYLTSLVTGCPSSLNVQSYAATLRELSTRRKVLEIAHQLAQGAYNQKVKIDSVISDATAGLISSVRDTGSTEHISAVVSRLYDEIDEAAKNPRETFGIKTGIASIDKYLYGIQRRATFLITGDPGVGKSLLAFQLCCGMASVGKTPGAVFLLEMTSEATVRRRLAGLSGVKTSDMRKGSVKENEWTVLVSAIEKLAAYDVYLSDRSTWNNVSIRAELTRLKAQHNIGWYLVDYLAPFMKNCPGKDDNERGAFAMGELQAMAKDLDLAGVIIHDKNKEGMGNKVSGQASLAGSRAIPYAADLIGNLKKKDTIGQYRLDFEKIREEAQTEFIDFRRPAGSTQFQELELHLP